MGPLPEAVGPASTKLGSSEAENSEWGLPLRGAKTLDTAYQFARMLLPAQAIGLGILVFGRREVTRYMPLAKEAIEGLIEGRIGEILKHQESAFLLVNALTLEETARYILDKCVKEEGVDLGEIARTRPERLHRFLLNHADSVGRDALERMLDIPRKSEYLSILQDHLGLISVSSRAVPELGLERAIGKLILGLEEEGGSL